MVLYSITLVVFSFCFFPRISVVLFSSFIVNSLTRIVRSSKKPSLECPVLTYPVVLVLQFYFIFLIVNPYDMGCFNRKSFPLYFRKVLFSTPSSGGLDRVFFYEFSQEVRFSFRKINHCVFVHFHILSECFYSCVSLSVVGL